MIGHRTPTISIVLLVVFAAGGLLAPMLHRISHVHEVEHRHGDPAIEFSAVVGDVGGTDFVVEEQTPLQELTCELCARLSVTAAASRDNTSDHIFQTPLDSHADDRASSRLALSSRSRAPPTAG